MIIKSRVLSFGFAVSIVMLIGSSTAVLFAFLDLALHLNIGFKTMPLPGKIFFSLVMLIAICISGKLLWDSNILRIDTNLKNIKFTNRLIWTSKNYDFNYFDYSIIVYEPIKGGYARNYYLIKNNKVIKRIYSLMYSNQNELEIGLNDIKSLGEIKYSYINSAKILFGLPILEKGSI